MGLDLFLTKKKRSEIGYFRKVNFLVKFFESDWVEYASVLFDKTLDLLFNEDGVDDIDWWMYEKSGNPELKMWDENGKEIPTDTVEDLWNLVKDNQK